MCFPTQRPEQEYRPEEGITHWIHKELVGRNNNNKINTWEALWRLLFPGTLIPPAGLCPRCLCSPHHILTDQANTDYEPCIPVAPYEFVEVAQQARANATRKVRRRFTAMIGDDSVATELAQQADSIIEQSLTKFFRKFEKALLPEYVHYCRTKWIKKKNHFPKEPGPTATPAVSERQSQRRRLRALAPAPAIAVPHQANPPISSLSSSYPTTSAHSLEQRYSCQGPPPPMPMTAYQAFSAFTTQATPAIASPAPVQQHQAHLEHTTTLLLNQPSNGTVSPDFPLPVHSSHAGPVISGAYPGTHDASGPIYSVYRSPNFPPDSPVPSQLRQQNTAAHGPRARTSYHAS
ncbi:hypothetical protein VTK26DRAFT_4804 [Humicola hyalothermophila]